MDGMNRDLNRKIHWAAGGFVLLASLITYFRTVAPTTSFWDCGEFIASCYILGVPHPPGYPVYTLIGRLFSILPMFGDIAVRVNFLSAASNAVAAMFGYLTLVRVLRLWHGHDLREYTRLLIYAGAACGALLMAFGLTQWNNSVEAEVYGLTMLLFMACFWMTLIYYERRDSLGADRLMLVVVYLATLGIGVHLTAFMVLLVCGVVFVLKKDTPPGYWFLIAAFFAFELYLIFALSSRPDEIPYYIPVAVVAVFYAFFVFSLERMPSGLLLLAVGFLAALAPMFVDLAAMIRSGGSTSTAAPAVLHWLGSAVLVVITTLVVGETA